MVIIPFYILYFISNSSHFEKGISSEVSQVSRSVNRPRTLDLGNNPFVECCRSYTLEAQAAATAGGTKYENNKNEYLLHILLKWCYL